ncbi:MAG TPA: lysophospholipid acyltransferase family protein, partial [Gemmatimonadaceae bacterium]|nr:lysophospholipid acyltransferase family protein [Gemmatimonadaceae bacterium]
MIIFTIIRTIITAIVAVLATTVGGLSAIIAGLFGVEDRAGGIFDHTPRVWSRVILWAAGIKTVVHNPERMAGTEPRVYLSNHLSWFDIPALAGALPRYKFVAKAELFKIPVFGPAIKAIGMVPMERQNRKAAFEAYKVAADKIRSGSSVVVFPEGTRGQSYAIRPFKKGPFVLAIAAGVPIVPVLLHGTYDVLPKGGWLVRSGQFDIHLLEPVPTAGLDYSAREELAEKVRSQIVEALASIYGIESEPTRSL